MKKIFVVVLAVSLGLALNVFAQGSAGSDVQLKQKTESASGVTTTKTEVKDTATGVKAKEEVVTTGTSTVTKEEIKGKNIKMKTEEIDTAAGKAGIAKVDVKKGAISEMQIDWTYHQEGPDYITEYTIKDKTNKTLLKELNLTPDQANMIKPGTHKIVSTSPFTGEDIRNDFRAVILKDLKKSIVTK